MQTLLLAIFIAFLYVIDNLAHNLPENGELNWGAISEVAALLSLSELAIYVHNLMQIR